MARNAPKLELRTKIVQCRCRHVAWTPLRHGLHLALASPMKLGMRSRVTANDVHDGLTTAVLALDDRLQISTVNAAAEGLFEISRRLALGTPLREAIVPFAPHERRLRDALDSSTGFIERELKLLRHGSVPVTVDLTVTPFVIDRKPGLLLEMVALDRHLRISRDDMLQTQFDAKIGRAHV